MDKTDLESNKSVETNLTPKEKAAKIELLFEVAEMYSEYAKVDYEKAIKYERLAVKQSPKGKNKLLSKAVKYITSARDSIQRAHNVYLAAIDFCSISGVKERVGSSQKRLDNSEKLVEEYKFKRSNIIDQLLGF